MSEKQVTILQQRKAADLALKLDEVANDHDEWKIHSQKWEAEANDLLRENELLREKRDASECDKLAEWIAYADKLEGFLELVCGKSKDDLMKMHAAEGLRLVRPDAAAPE